MYTRCFYGGHTAPIQAFFPSREGRQYTNLSSSLARRSEALSICMRIWDRVVERCVGDLKDVAVILSGDACGRGVSAQAHERIHLRGHGRRRP